MVLEPTPVVLLLALARTSFWKFLYRLRHYQFFHRMFSARCFDRSLLPCLGLCFLLAMSCIRARVGYITASNTVEINLDSGVIHPSISGHVDSLSAINLETGDHSLISDAGNIRKIVFKDNKFFILDEKFMSIKAFDMAGRYLFDLGKLGLGKGEFVHIADMEYYPPHNTIMILCEQPRKVTEFTLNGSFVKDSNLDFWASGFAFPSANSRIFYINQNINDASGKKNVLFTDSNNAITSTMFDLPTNISAEVKFSGGLFSTGHSIYFNPVFSDTYYSLSGDTANPVFKIDYGKKAIPAGVGQSELFNRLENFSFQFNTFVKVKEWIGFNYLNRQKSTVFFNTISRKMMVSNVSADSLDILFSNSMFECDDELVMILDSNILSEFLRRNQDSIKRKFPNLYAHLNFQKTHQNPTLLRFTLRTI